MSPGSVPNNGLRRLALEATTEPLPEPAEPPQEPRNLHQNLQSHIPGTNRIGTPQQPHHNLLNHAEPSRNLHRNQDRKLHRTLKMDWDP